MDVVTDTQWHSCHRCHIQIRATDYYCFNCGVNLRPTAPATDWGSQVWLYLKSILLPPLGLWWGGALYPLARQ